MRAAREWAAWWAIMTYDVAREIAHDVARGWELGVARHHARGRR